MPLDADAPRCRPLDADAPPGCRPPLDADSPGCRLLWMQTPLDANPSWMQTPRKQTPPWTHKRLWKHNLRKLRWRVVIMCTNIKIGQTNAATILFFIVSGSKRKKAFFLIAIKNRKLASFIYCLKRKQNQHFTEGFHLVGLQRRK